jgi:ABC-2 type transport system permease protein
MIRTITSEWIKLRTVLVHWVLAIIAIAFPLVITVLASIFGDFFEDGSQLSDEIAGLVVGTAIVSAMLLGAMGAISLTGEFGHNTIRPTFAATPSRLRVHAAKLIVNSVVIAVIALVALLVTWFAAQAILAARDRTISIGDGDVLVSMVSLVVLAVIVSGFGFALGLLIRNSPATVTILLLWPLIIENLVGGLLTVVGAGRCGQVPALLGRSARRGRRRQRRRPRAPDGSRVVRRRGAGAARRRPRARQQARRLIRVHVVSDTT